MDADDVSLPTRFERQVARLDSDSGLVAVGTRALLVVPRGGVIGEAFRLTTHEEIDRSHLGGGGSAMAHPSVMMRRDALLAVGGYRAEFEPAEDVDLWLRLAEHGRLANLPEVLLQYRLHGGNVSYSRAAAQRANLGRAIGEAYARRGLAGPPPVVAEPPAGATVPQYHWVRMAVLLGELDNARRLAVRACVEFPWRAESWQVLALALLGPRAQSVLRLRRAVLGR